MRLLIVYCHPVEGSFGSAVRDAVLEAAREAGHETRLTDLYAEGFDPVMCRDERIGYHDRETNEIPVARHLADVRWAEGLIFVHPTWWYGPPAMLKGWLDRVFVPHVAFRMPTETRGIRPGLANIRLIGQVSTLGSSWWLWRFMGQPGRRIILRGLRACCAPACRTFWLGLHSMDTVPEPRRTAFLARVRRRIARIR